MAVGNIFKSGTSQWIFQRVSNLVIVAYSVLLVALLACMPEVNVTELKALIGTSWFKIVSSVCIVVFALNSILAGWQIAGDYIKGAGGTLFNLVCTVVSLAMAVFGLLLFWG